MENTPQPPSDSLPDLPAPPPPPKVLPFAGWWPVVAGMLVGVAIRLLFSGQPGQRYGAMMGSFVYLVPLLVGAVTVYVAERQHRRSWLYYVYAPALASTLFVLGTLALLIEGLICAIVIVPLFSLISVIGGLMMGAVCRLTRWPKKALYSVAALPMLLGGLEDRVPLPERTETVERVRLVQASPDSLWRQLQDARGILPQEVGDAWVYRIGVPLPEEGAFEQTREGVVRHVTMGKGIHFDQVAQEWVPGRRVRWTYRFSEDSFPPRALDDHVRIGGHYFDLHDTTYTLTPRGEATEIRIQMRYRVSTRFNWYARPVADFLIGNFEEVILRFYAQRAEAESRSQPQGFPKSVP